MQVVRGDGDFIHKGGAQMFDGAAGGMVLGIAGDDDGFVEFADEGGGGEAGLAGVTVAAIAFEDFEADVPGVHDDVLVIADAEIEVADVEAVGGDDAEMVSGDGAELVIAGFDAQETEVDLAGGQGVRRAGKGIYFGRAVQVRGI